MSENGPEAEFSEALHDLETVFANSIRAFAKWYAANWTTTREQWGKEYSDPPPEGDWFDWHNAAVEGIGMACDVFLDEFNLARP